MRISLNINYRTQWGEQLYVSGDIPALGSGNEHAAPAMKMVGPAQWRLEIDVEELPESVKYRYIVKPDQGAWRMEWGHRHRISRINGVARLDVYDCWQDQPLDKPYYSSAFVDGILSRRFRDQPLKPLPDTLTVRIAAPMIEPDEVLAMAGSIPALGCWDPHQALRLNDARYPVWEGAIPLDKIDGPFEYKFVILKKDTLEPVGWELLDNRVFGIETKAAANRAYILDGLRFANPRNNWRGAGTAIPVFSVRSEADFGCGDFVDLRRMVDWCVLTGQKVLQLLPINDTTLTGTWVDSYPYKTNSTFALHPMYIRLEEVGSLTDEKMRAEFNALRTELNSLAEIDYERVNNAKRRYLEAIYKVSGKSTAKKESYLRFMEKNGEWLRPYAAWSILRDLNGTPDNTRWGEYATYDARKVKAFLAEHACEAGYYYFVQYHLDRQLREVRDYAHQNGVVLKGDIPIGIGRHSVDAWLYPQLFNMQVSAGAPPDDFSVMGQNWGLPTYNWEKMAEDGFAWWKARFRKMAEYFDAYRIDHILGFFRIWQIPVDALHGLLGYFNPALPFSPEEMRHNYDFWLNADLQAHPLILEWMLTDFFGEHTQEAKERFLEHTGGDRYRLKDFVNTQVKVAEYFATQEKNEKNDRLCNALLGLIDDVLFIEDPEQRGKYHPRISAQFTYQYRCLNDYERQCFDRLYNDFFYRRHNEFWGGKALWKLPPLLDSTPMLTCAEDLGMIPDCVPHVMRELEILSLEIQSMPKDPRTEFGNTWGYPYFSVCTTSTHDMAGIRLWWEEDRQRSQRYFNEVLNEGGAAPHFAEPWICGRILDLNLQSPSMLCIIPLQDWLSADGALRRENPADERINIPANPKHYWRYRMHLTVDQLMAANTFNATLRDHIKGAGR
ncbi:MAG: 4-alpha-glucanotransferase [Porphyromonadaceae bacterium]|nr:4-alpha-glucanotransferase [Porphyromonadaceae bacterium]